MRQFYVNQILDFKVAQYGQYPNLYQIYNADKPIMTTVILQSELIYPLNPLLRIEPITDINLTTFKNSKFK